MTPENKKRVARLSQIATLKADLAKLDAAECRANEARIKSLRDDISERAKAAALAGNSPDAALSAQRFLSFCDQELMDLNREMARARVQLDKRMRIARIEEGRRQVICKLLKK